jgi:hypothetical protein
MLKFARLAISSQFLLEATVLVVRVLIEEFLEERSADNLDDGQGHLRISWHSCCQTFMRQRTDEHWRGAFPGANWPGGSGNSITRLVFLD